MSPRSLLIVSLYYLYVNAFHAPTYKTSGFKTNLRRVSHVNMVSTFSDGREEAINELIASKQFHDAFSYVLRNPHVQLTNEQVAPLLNNLNDLARFDSPDAVKRLYKRLSKSGTALPSFGIMNTDGPLSELDLPQFERIMAQDFSFFQEACGLDKDAFFSIGIPNENGNAPSAEMRRWEYSSNIQLAGLLGFFQVAVSLLSGIETSELTTSIGLTSLAAAFFVIIESPVYLNGEIGRTMGWMKDTLQQSLSPLKEQAQKRAYRSSAATLLVSYLLGSPIQCVDLDPSDPATRKRFRYPDAPRVDIRDSALSVVLANEGKLDLPGLKRMATIHMAASALEALETGKTKLSDYTKLLLAALGQRAANPMHSTITSDQFPRRLLPTLARYGFVDALLIMQEARGAIDEIVKVFESGGGVGDAILAIEKCMQPEIDPFADMVIAMPDDLPLVDGVVPLGSVDFATPMRAVDIRRAHRLEKEARAQKKSSSVFKALEAVLRARQVATPSPEVDDVGPIEYIKGTDRIYTKEELILPRNPSPEQVKELARDIMTMKMNGELKLYGRVTPQTQTEVKLLAASVSAALRVYNYDADKRTSGSSSGATSAAASVAQVTQDDPSLSPMSPEEFSNILKEVGLAEDQLPNWLRSFYALPENVRKMTGVDPLELSAETLADIHALRSALTKAYGDAESWWVFKGTWILLSIAATVKRYTGMDTHSSVDSTWDAVSLNTGIDSDPTPKRAAFERPTVGKTINRQVVKDLVRLVDRITFTPPKDKSGFGGIMVVPVDPDDEEALSSAAPISLGNLMKTDDVSVGDMESAATSSAFTADKNAHEGPVSSPSGSGSSISAPNGAGAGAVALSAQTASPSKKTDNHEIIQEPLPVTATVAAAASTEALAVSTASEDADEEDDASISPELTAFHQGASRTSVYSSATAPFASKEFSLANMMLLTRTGSLFRELDYERRNVIRKGAKATQRMEEIAEKLKEMKRSSK